MKIDVKIDTANLKLKTAREQKRLAYGTANALNAATKEIQADERANLDRTFKIRQAGFMYRLIKITTFASPSRGTPYTELAVDTSKARVLLSTFEQGGEKDPVKGKNVAVPITGSAARPSFSNPVAEQYRFSKLGFHRQNLTKAGQTANAARKRFGVRGRLTKDYYIWAGAERTFILPKASNAPYGGVFQRVGPGPDDIRLIYAFQPHPKLKRVLRFVETAQKKFAEAFNRAFDREYRNKT
jgi:hypothetical protein